VNADYRCKKRGRQERPLFANPLRGAAPTALDCLFTVHPALPGWANSFRAYGAGETPKPLRLFGVALRQFAAFTFDARKEAAKSGLFRAKLFDHFVIASTICTPRTILAV
jgi:hypothetical protein